MISVDISFYASVRVSQGFWGTREHWQNIEGNKGTLANFWEQGNKIRKITILKHSERVWEHGNIGQFWKGTREQGPPWETLIGRYIGRDSVEYRSSIGRYLVGTRSIYPPKLG